MDPRLKAALDENGLDPDHPAEVEAEAAALARDPGIDQGDLVDRTDLPFVTIDERWSRDLDQAVFVERSGRGWVVWYAIADAAWFVRPGSALFAEALRRGASFYLPGLVVPMLPRSLSEDVVSLNEGVDRRALLFRIPLDGDGHPTGSTVERARVRSRSKLAWEDVQRFYDGGPAPADADSLEALREVGKARLKLAIDRDVVRFRRDEVEVRLGDGARFVAYADVRTEVELYNEQVSLLCNTEGAYLLDGHSEHVQPIFRVHEPPAPERLEALERQVAALGRVHGLDPALWQPRQGESLADWLARIPEDGAHARIAAAIHRQALVSNGRASFTADPGRHYGVGAGLYARFTAPMREIVGVFLHKELMEQRDGASLGLPAGFASDEALRDEVIAASNRARDLQRRLDQEANRIVLDQLFEDDLAHGRPERRATVMGLSRGKVHVQLDDPPIDVKVYLAHLERCVGAPLLIDRPGVAVRRRQGGRVVLRVGDPVRVRVSGRDAGRDRWALDCVRG